MTDEYKLILHYISILYDSYKLDLNSSTVAFCFLVCDIVDGN
jgi:hypothetical protein